MTPLAVITIHLAPEIHLGPVTIAWHGLTIALGILLGGVYAARRVRRQGLPPEPVQNLVGLAGLGGLVGGRLFYVFEHGGSLLGTRGFTFDGGLILAAVLIVVYVRRTQLQSAYLDACAVGLPLGVAIGRIGDLINGEHYGARSTSFLAVRNANPDALTPDPRFAYENGGLYEILLGALVFVILLAVQRHVRRPGDLAWLVFALLSVGRFFEFFLRSDSPNLALGLNNAQWTSIALLVVVIVGRTVSVRRERSRERERERALAA